MSITMKYIARELGVSVATVSRALKNSPRISAEQRERINKFAREHDFVPNIMRKVCETAERNLKRLLVLSFRNSLISTFRLFSVVSNKRLLLGDTTS